MRVVANVQPLMLVAPGRADHEQVGIRAPGERAKPLRHRLRLDADRLGVDAELVSQRREPLERTPVVGLLPDGARIGGRLRA